MEENQVMESEVETVDVCENASGGTTDIQFRSEDAPAVYNETESKINFGGIALTAAAITGVFAVGRLAYKKIKRFKAVYQMGLRYEAKLDEDFDQVVDYFTDAEEVDSTENDNNGSETIVDEFIDKRKGEKGGK